MHYSYVKKNTLTGNSRALEKSLQLLFSHLFLCSQILVMFYDNRNKWTCPVYLLKELSHSILSYFGHIQNYLQIKGNMKIVVY